MEMNAYKDFHIFACMSVIKTCVTGLVLKDKDVQHWKSISSFSQIALMSLWSTLKNPKPIEDASSFGYFLHILNILILKMIVVLWIPNSLTSFANFSFSLNLLKTCPWWYATFIIPFLFVLIISSYRLFLLLFPDLVPLLLLCLYRQILDFRLWSLNLVITFLSLLLIYVLSFYYLPSLSRSINKKNSHYSTKSKSKTKIFIQIIFFSLQV